MKSKRYFTVTLPPVLFHCGLSLIGLSIISIIMLAAASKSPYYDIFICSALIIIFGMTAMIWQKRFRITVNGYTIIVRRFMGRKYCFDVSQIVRIDWRTVETAYGTNELVKVSTASSHFTIESVMVGSDEMRAYLSENVDSSIINRTYEDPFNIKKNNK